jgi:aminoglycoside 3-N-acetyltransferase
MSEKKVIDSSISPVSSEDIFRDLTQLGLQKGDSVIVHSSLKSMGWVIGAEVALIQALVQVVGPKGHIVMPAQTGHLGDPALWENPPVPSAWVSKIKATMPAFDKDRTPTYHMGRVAELFRTWPGVIRSNHPHASFCAWGKDASTLMADHALTSAFGKKSPLNKMLKKPFKILLIGVDYDVCTALHYAEALQPDPPLEKKTMTILENNERKIIEVMDVEYSTKYFKKIGHGFEKEHRARKGLVGHASSRLVELSALIDYATTFFADLGAQKQKKPIK